MAGRHEFKPVRNLSPTSGEEVSNYDYSAQLKAHHEAAMAGWNKPAGLHKRESVVTAASNRPARKIASTILTSLLPPHLGR